MVEQSPRHPKVQGSSLAAAAGIGREESDKKVFLATLIGELHTYEGASVVPL